MFTPNVTYISGINCCCGMMLLEIHRNGFLLKCIYILWFRIMSATLVNCKSDCNYHTSRVAL